MLENFQQVLPEVILDAAERLGGRCTGRFYALHALENRVYDIEMEEGPHVVIKFYRPGRWSRATIESEHNFLKGIPERPLKLLVTLKNAIDTLLPNASRPTLHLLTCRVHFLRPSAGQRHE